MRKWTREREMALLRTGLHGLPRCRGLQHAQHCTVCQPNRAVFSAGRRPPTKMASSESAALPQLPSTTPHTPPGLAITPNHQTDSPTTPSYAPDHVCAVLRVQLSIALLPLASGCRTPRPAGCRLLAGCAALAGLLAGGAREGGLGGARLGSGTWCAARLGLQVGVGQWVR